MATIICSDADSVVEQSEYSNQKEEEERNVTLENLSLLLVVAVLACRWSPAAPTEASPPSSEGAGSRPAGRRRKADGTAGDPDRLVIGLAVHDNPAESSFWGVVETGAKDAAAAMGVELKSGGSGDPAEQAQLIETYIADGVDGIIVSLANPDAMKDAVLKADGRWHPGHHHQLWCGHLQGAGRHHPRRPDRVCGRSGRRRASSTLPGATKVLCVIHEEGNIGLEERCDGLADTFGGDDRAL